MYLRLLVSLGIAVSVSGCGLALDYGPPDRARDAQGSATFDANVERTDTGLERDASMDAATLRDAADPIDGSTGVGDAIVVSVDAANAGDATTVGDALPPADAFVPPADAFVPRDVGSDSAVTTMRDAARDALVAPDTSGMACPGMPPNAATGMCDLGNCLCSRTGLCYATAMAAACCPGGSLACSGPTTDCFWTHPIVGPPRTCSSGLCYCANPDGCFPPETAARCCAVSVACVP